MSKTCKFCCFWKSSQAALRFNNNLGVCINGNNSFCTDTGTAVGIIRQSENYAILHSVLNVDEPETNLFVTNAVFGCIHHVAE